MGASLGPGVNTAEDRKRYYGAMTPLKTTIHGVSSAGYELLPGGMFDRVSRA